MNSRGGTGDLQQLDTNVFDKAPEIPGLHERVTAWTHVFKSAFTHWWVGGVLEKRESGGQV